MKKLHSICQQQNNFFVVRYGGDKEKGTRCKYVVYKWVGVPVQHGWALWPEYFLNLALFHLKIPKSTTQGPDLTGRATTRKSSRPKVLTRFVRMSGKLG